MLATHHPAVILSLWLLSTCRLRILPADQLVLSAQSVVARMHGVQKPDSGWTPQLTTSLRTRLEYKLFNARIRVNTRYTSYCI